MSPPISRPGAARLCPGVSGALYSPFPQGLGVYPALCPLLQDQGCHPSSSGCQELGSQRPHLPDHCRSAAPAGACLRDRGSGIVRSSSQGTARRMLLFLLRSQRLSLSFCPKFPTPNQPEKVSGTSSVCGIHSDTCTLREEHVMAQSVHTV